MDAWNSPKRDPIVSTGSPSAATSTEAKTIATIGAGTVRDSRGHRSRMASEPADTATACGLTVARLAPNALHFSRKGPGTASICSPKRSPTCEEKMMTAMPLVKPVTTG